MEHFAVTHKFSVDALIEQSEILFVYQSDNWKMALIEENYVLKISWIIP